MKNFIKGLKEVKGGGDLSNAQAVIVANYPYTMCGEPNEKTIKKLIKEAHPADIVALCNYLEKHPEADQRQATIRILTACKYY